MGDLSQLADRLDRLAVSIPAQTNETAKEVATTILFDLSEVTPVDTGLAVSNWQASLDAPTEDIVPAAVPSKKGRMVNGVWTHSVLPEITRDANQPILLAEGQIVIGLKQPGQPVYLTNSLPYIQRLNDGYSQQAPAGFVDRAISLAKSVVAKLKLTL